jgi:hypothetical protein
MDFKPSTDDIFKLGDISDYSHADDLISIGSATVFIINLVTAFTRMGIIGGKSLNMYFDTFGLEGILANTSLVVIMFQVARYAYTKFYSEGGRPWSPFVFISCLIGVQILHNIIFYYGVIRVVPTGNNEMIDALKKYSAENGSRALAGHAAFLIFVGIAAMFLKERSLIFIVMTTVFTLYLLPYVITTFGPKPAPPPAAEKKPVAQQPDMQGWNGPRY